MGTVPQDRTISFRAIRVVNCWIGHVVLTTREVPQPSYTVHYPNSNHVHYTYLNTRKHVSVYFLGDCYILA